MTQKRWQRWLGWGGLCFFCTISPTWAQTPSTTPPTTAPPTRTTPKPSPAPNTKRTDQWSPGPFRNPWWVGPKSRRKRRLRRDDFRSEADWKYYQRVKLASNLRKAGWSILIASYLGYMHVNLMIFIGAKISSNNQTPNFGNFTLTYFPIFGPLVYAIAESTRPAPPSSSLTPASGFFLVLLSLTQTLGLTLAIVGHTLISKEKTLIPPPPLTPKQTLSHPHRNTGALMIYQRGL